GQPSESAATKRSAEPIPARARVIIRNEVAAGADAYKGAGAV
ncbi:unnamed protein product, partial [Laminaria digitata]